MTNHPPNPTTSPGTLSTENSRKELFKEALLSGAVLGEGARNGAGGGKTQPRCSRWEWLPSHTDVISHPEVGWSREELQEEPTAPTGSATADVPPRHPGERLLGWRSPWWGHPEAKLCLQGSRGVPGAEGAEGKPGTQVPILHLYLAGDGGWDVGTGTAEPMGTLPVLPSLCGTKP